jgi:hypothetical protein
MVLRRFVFILCLILTFFTECMFDVYVSTTVQAGNGARTLFWRDRRIDGASIEQSAQDVVAVVDKSTQKTRLVVDAM